MKDKIYSWTVSTLERVKSTILPSLYVLSFFYDFDLRASHARVILEGKFHKEKPKRKSRSSGIWSTTTRPYRVFQGQKVAQTTPLLPYFLEHEENLGSAKSLWSRFSWLSVRMILTASRKYNAFLASYDALRHNSVTQPIILHQLVHESSLKNLSSCITER